MSTEGPGIHEITFHVEVTDAQARDWLNYERDMQAPLSTDLLFAAYEMAVQAGLVAPLFAKRNADRNGWILTEDRT